jgi:predicted metal-dependent hydrolase
MIQISINGIPVEVEKKRIKNMYLRILPPDGRLHISAPLKMSDEEIRRFVLTKQEWIRRHQARIRVLHVHQEPEYINGEKISVWGKLCQLEVVDALSHSRVEATGDKVVLYVKQGSTREQRVKLLNQWYRKSLEAEVPRLLEQWERIIRVKASGYSLRDMKTRWGSCNVRTGKICLNLQLAGKPYDCLEYVVVHELVHLLEKSHNSVFKGYMDRFLPQWRNLKKILNSQVTSLTGF